jgi:PKD repeat protein
LKDTGNKNQFFYSKVKERISGLKRLIIPMSKFTIPGLVIILAFPFQMMAEWVSLSKNNSSQLPPQVTLVSDDISSTVLKIEITGFELRDLVSGDKQYRIADLLTESFTNDPGFPAVPYISKVLAVPDQAGISCEVLELGEIQSFSNIDLPPARKSWQEGSPEPAYLENAGAYNSLSVYPSDFVQLDKPSVFRDFRIIRVAVFPMRYIPEIKELQAVTSITIRISYGPGEVINPKTAVTKPIAPSFGKIYQESIFNYESVLNKYYGGKEEGHDLMLCIMPDEFVASFQVYSTWKRQSGVDIHVTKFSDIGANATDPVIIKNHIIDAYHNWEVPPTYVLIIGDDGVFPKYLVTLDGWTFPNEDYFVEIDGNDYFPELMIGRFTNQGDYRLQVMVNKFIKYEKTPFINDTSWFRKGICCSNDAYPSQPETKRFAAARMLQDGGFISVDTMMSDPGCTYGLNDILNAINNGRSYLNYRGEGWYSGWNANCYSFSPADVNSSVLNGEKLTFVTSIGCGVAMFNSEGNNCFGEAWVEIGSLTDIKGAPAFIGPTSNTHTAYNNNIDRGIYKGMFQEGMDTPGQALIRGKLEMYNVFGDIDPFVEYHYKTYCILGDPSIHIWKKVPLAVSVNHAVTIPPGNNLVEFSVNHTQNGQPVDEAVVCVTGNTVFCTGITDPTGKAYLYITAPTQDTLTVTVRGGDVFTFQDTIFVLQPAGPYIVNDSCEISDIAGGNGNGFMETSETILASLTVQNVGLQSAANVMVTISTTDDFVSITDNAESYGTISAGSTAVVPNGFGWEVGNNIPDLHNVIFEMTATNGTDNWISYFNVVGHAPLLEPGAMTIDDAAGNGNGRLDPGETASLLIPTYNNGTYQANGTIGSLSCPSSFITLNNANYNFGVMPAGSMDQAVFSLSVSPDAPIGTGVSFMYEVTSGGYSVQYNYAASIGVIVEDWETGNMSQFNWITGGSSNWAVTTNNPYEGSYCIKSGALGNNQTNYLSLEYSIANADSISFWFKVSSEAGYDYLKFYIDDDEQSEWSGEVGWMRNAYAVTAGVHTFKWSYVKDQSVAGGSDCAWIDYILLPVSVLQASFTASETEVCEGGTINFYDQSPAGVTSWYWIFEGGIPATSSEQNPTVLYPAQGVYDVSLTVSNGSGNNTLEVNNYITVVSIPASPPSPFGPSSVCGNTVGTLYNTSGLSGISEYTWLLEPNEAGNVTGSGLNATVAWEDGFLGEATLKVAGLNICGSGSYSAPLNILRYLPEVTLDTFNWVCLDWPAFELTGGLPEGGTYSGPGVDNGWFDPSLAGIGTHTITYTYSDPNNCENSATNTILVDPCTGFDELTDYASVCIYPNPTTGIITISGKDVTGEMEVTVVNLLNKTLYQGTGTTARDNEIEIDLNSLNKGIYFIRLRNERIEKTIKVILE